jgi:peroxiredoxin
METIRSGEAFEGDIRLTIAGDRLRVGDAAPDFALDALAPGEAVPREVTLASGAGRVRLLHVVNSLDTPVCHVGTHRFEELRTAQLPANVDVYTVSMDLPFAQARWRAAESLHTTHCRVTGAKRLGAITACCFVSGGCCSAQCSSSTRTGAFDTPNTLPIKWPSRITTPRSRRHALELDLSGPTMRA